MRKKKMNLIEEKQEKLINLQSRSKNALNIVTDTIEVLSYVNEEIENTISEIDKDREDLDKTREELNSTKQQNVAIVEKFKTLIGD
ncbi:hypothetical protein [Clostridium sp.]|uniref:hypothetical protein n=1 Tax=Clostridium sp. TaxID=1506 RepID=UPI0032172D8B